MNTEPYLAELRRLKPDSSVIRLSDFNPSVSPGTAAGDHRRLRRRGRAFFSRLWRAIRARFAGPVYCERTHERRRADGSVERWTTVELIEPRRTRR